MTIRLTLLVALALHTAAAAEPIDVKQVLRQLAEKQGSFNPEALHQAGKEGLAQSSFSDSF